MYKDYFMSEVLVKEKVSPSYILNLYEDDLYRQ